MKVLVKKPGEPLQVVDTNEKYFGDCAKSIIGKDSYIERVYIEGMQFIMGVDENGMYKNLPINFFIPFDNAFYPIQKIYGTAVFVRNKYCDPFTEEIYDYEVIDIKEDDKKWLENILKPVNQLYLYNRFKSFY